MLRMFSLCSLVMCSSVALAESEKKPLTSGEFYDVTNGANTAHTLEKGEFAYHPLFKTSAVGITDEFDMKFATLGLIGGPALAFEYAFVQSDDMAVSLEPGFGSTWDFKNYSGGGSLRFTKGLGDNRLNVGVGGLFTKTTVVIKSGSASQEVVLTGFDVPLDLGYDLVTSDATTFTFSTHVRPLTMASDVEIAGLYAVPHFAWSQGIGKKFRTALGVNVLIGGLSQEVVDVLALIGYDVGKTAVVPLPHFQMWWKF